MSFRQMVYDAGVSGAQISRALGRNEAWVRERLRSHRQFNFDDMRVIAALARIPVAKLYNLHMDEFQAAGLSDDRRQTNKMWSAEEDATLRRYAERGLTIPDLARALGRSYSAAFSRATRLGVHFARAESGTALEMIAQQVGRTQPMRPADEEAVAALYAKYGNYGGDTSKPGTVNPTFMPHRPMAISACGSTAQMCVEFAR
jgi:cyanate lyase